MSWAVDTLERLDELKRESYAANQASLAAFERLHALGRELYEKRGARGVATHAVQGGACAYSVAMREEQRHSYRPEEITPETATLAQSARSDDDPEPDELGARCHAAWLELGRLGGAANGARDRLEAAIREAVGT